MLLCRLFGHADKCSMPIQARSVCDSAIPSTFANFPTVKLGPNFDLGFDKFPNQQKSNFSSWFLSTSSFYSLYIATHSDPHSLQQINSLKLSQFSSARVCMIRKEPDHEHVLELSRGQSVNSHVS